MIYISLLFCLLLFKTQSDSLGQIHMTNNKLKSTENSEIENNLDEQSLPLLTLEDQPLSKKNKEKDNKFLHQPANKAKSFEIISKDQDKVIISDKVHSLMARSYTAYNLGLRTDCLNEKYGFTKERSRCVFLNKFKVRNTQKDFSCKK